MESTEIDSFNILIACDGTKEEIVTTEEILEEVDVPCDFYVEKQVNVDMENDNHIEDIKMENTDCQVHENIQTYMVNGNHNNDNKETDLNLNDNDDKATEVLVELNNSEGDDQTFTSNQNKEVSTKTPPEVVNYGFYSDDKFDTWLADAYLTKSSIWYVNTYDEVLAILSEFEQKTMSRYSTQAVGRNFGTADIYMKKHKIRWDGEGLQYDGVPFMFTGIKYLDCQFGKDRKAVQKRLSREKILQKATIPKKTSLLGKTKKFGCEAQIRLKEIIKFPEFKLHTNSDWRRVNTSKLIRKAMLTKNVVCEKMFIVILPSKMEHSRHLIGEKNAREKLNIDVVMKIQEFYLNNNSTPQILALISEYVRNENCEIFTGTAAKRNKCQLQRSDVRNIAQQIRVLGKMDKESMDKINTLLNGSETLSFFCVDELKILMDSGDEISDVEEKVETEPNGGPKRRRSKQKSVETFVFVYRTRFQEKMLKKYNQVLYIIEVNCNTLIKRTLPYEMYALVVQTCLDYQVVCTIVVSKQRKNALVEALQDIKDGISSSLPKYFFIDCSEKLVNAFEVVFPGVIYFYTYHSCCLHWKRFCSQNYVGITDHVDEVLLYLQNMACSYTEEALGVAAALFEASDVWQTSDQLRWWFQNSWLNNAKRWVRGYHPDDLHTMKHYKNTIVDATSIYEDEMKTTVKLNGLATLLASIIEKIPNKTKQRYIENVNAAFEEIHTPVFQPNWLGVPPLMLPLLNFYRDKVSEKTFNVNQTDYGVFTVEYIKTNKHIINEETNIVTVDNNGSSSTHENNPTKIEIETKFFRIEYENVCEEGEYTVSFGDDLNFPFCTCSYWQSYKLPCIHMYAILSNVEGWCYDMLSSLYRSNISFMLDYSYLQKSKPLNENPKDEIDKNPHKLFIDQSVNYLNQFKSSKEIPDQYKSTIARQMEMILDLLKEKEGKELECGPANSVQSISEMISKEAKRKNIKLCPIKRSCVILESSPKISKMSGPISQESVYNVGSVINLHIDNDIPIVLSSPSVDS